MLEIVEALAGAGVALLAGLWLVWLCLHRLKVEGGIVLVAVLFAPTLLWLGASGRLTEFKGLGIETKFREAASRKVSPSAKVKPIQPSVNDIQAATTRNIFFAIGTEVVLLRAPRQEASTAIEQSVLDLAQQIYPSLIQGRFEALVIVDAGDRVLGYFPRETFYDLLRVPVVWYERGDGVAQPAILPALKQTELWNIVKDPEVRAEREGQRLLLSTSDTNAEALSKMAEVNQNVAVATSPNGKYAGLVRRNDIVAHMLGALSTP